MTVYIVAVFDFPEIPAMMIMQKLVMYFLTRQRLDWYVSFTRVLRLVVHPGEKTVSITFSGQKESSLVAVSGHVAVLV